MTVSSTSSSIVFDGNGVTTTFPAGFRVDAAADLVVTYTDADGNDTILTTNQYSTDGHFGYLFPTGPTVTYNPLSVPIATGTTLTLERDISPTQPTSIANQGAMWPAVIEAAFDRVVMILQGFLDGVGRSLRIPITDDTDLNDLPGAADRADGYLGFDGDGQPTVIAGTAGTVPISVAMAAVVNQSTLALARTAMGAAGGADNNTYLATNDFTAGRAKVPTRSSVNDNGTDAASTAFVAALFAAVGTKLIQGLTYQNNAGDATNDIDIAAGSCMDGGGSYLMVLSALTKRLDAGWAVGTNQGALDTGSIGNSDYYIWAIARSDTGVTDILFSLSSTAPTMPGAGVYDKKRLIGWFKRAGATIVAFKTYEGDGGALDFLWSAPRSDLNVANALTTTRRTDALSVPLNFSVLAHVWASAYDASTDGQAIVYCPDLADTTPTSPVSGTGIANLKWVPSAQVGAADAEVRTDATGKVAARSTVATTDIYSLVTIGFRWSRR